MKNTMYKNKLAIKGISKNSVYPSLLEKGDGLRPLKIWFLEMPLTNTEGFTS
jgi:hypothetical protein